MKLVTAAAMADIDRLSIEEYGYPGIVLMENAGIRMFERFLASPRDRSSRLVFIAGGGNNGGDALVMARLALFEGFVNSTIVLTSRRLGEAAGVHHRICRNLGLRILNWSDDDGEKEEAEAAVSKADVIFDGMIGTGLKGPLEGRAEYIAGCVNSSKAEVLAVDIPSGVGDTFEPRFPSIRADSTYTVGLPKQALYLPGARGRCGEISVIDIGFPRELLEAVELDTEILSIADLPSLLPAMNPEAYKNTRGSLCIFAGSPGTLGAAFLAAETASGTRTGLVTLMLDKNLYASAAGHFRSIIGRPGDPSVVPGKGDLDGYSALCVGPGWGFEDRKPCLDALFASGLPGVLDVDGLTLLGGYEEKPDLGGRWILTPHPGEFVRLTGMEKEEVLTHPRDAVKRAADSYNAVLVLKCHVTYIAVPGGKVYVVDGMNPALGTAGSGDVLAGLAGGLLAEGLSPADAAVSAVIVHGEAGRRCFSEYGWFAAEKLIGVIPRILADSAGG